MRTTFNTAIMHYPYDIQHPILNISSHDNPEGSLKLTLSTWNSLNGYPTNTQALDYGEPSLDTILHERFLDNSEWSFLGYNYQIAKTQSLLHQNKEFSTIMIEFELRRNNPFYTLTLFFPIFILTLLSPIGLILPGK